MTDIPLARMNGLGNQILVADLRSAGRALTADEVARLAADPAWRFDQLMALGPPRSEGTDGYVTIYNSDGSQAGACGNGMRCVGLYASRHGMADAQCWETTAGPLAVSSDASGRSITVDMGVPRFGWADIPLAEPFHDTRGIELQIGPIDAPILHTPSVVNVGNPHAVFWVADLFAYDLARVGALLEHHPIFPDRANISLARVEGPESIRVRTWERGAGLTRACGSAACAVAVCAARKGLTGRRVTVTLPGGALIIDWREADDHILMTGPAELEREGVL
jgi:diaminopimelate epimerase